MAWWWPFARKNKTPLERWLDSYESWLDDFQTVMRNFPDHTVLEGVLLSESEGRVLDQISDLYGEEAREVLEKMVLKAALLRHQKALQGGSRRVSSGGTTL